MDARPHGALKRRKPVQRLMRMIVLLGCMIGIFAASPLFYFSPIAHASAQSNGGGAVHGALAAPPASSSQPGFGSNVFIFNPTMPQSEIQATVDTIANQQIPNQFGTQRYALLFAPGTYGSSDNPLNFQVG